MARALRATGVPISTHTEPATPSWARAAEGVRVGGRRPDPGRHRPQRRHRRPRLPRATFDRRFLSGHGPLRALRNLSFEERVRTIVELCRRGHVGRIVLSHDAACHNDWLSFWRRYIAPRALLPHSPRRAPPRSGMPAFATQRGSTRVLFVDSQNPASSTCKARTKRRPLRVHHLEAEGQSKEVRRRRRRDHRHGSAEGCVSDAFAGLITEIGDEYSARTASTACHS